MVKCHQRVKRGQVYFYDCGKGEDKNKRHIIMVNGVEYPDCIEKGKRPWLVVSNNWVSKNNSLYTIVPLSTGGVDKPKYATHVRFNFLGSVSEILCEQIRTVNEAELVEYVSTLDDNIMEQVEQALSYYLDIRRSVEETPKTIKFILDSESIQAIQQILCEKLSVSMADEILNKMIDSAGVIIR